MFAALDAMDLLVGVLVILGIIALLMFILGRR